MACEVHTTCPGLLRAMAPRYMVCVVLAPVSTEVQRRFWGHGVPLSWATAKTGVVQTGSSEGRKVHVVHDAKVPGGNAP